MQISTAQTTGVAKLIANHYIRFRDVVMPDQFLSAQSTSACHSRQSLATDRNDPHSQYLVVGRILAVQSTVQAFPAYSEVLLCSRQEAFCAIATLSTQLACMRPRPTRSFKPIMLLSIWIVDPCGTSSSSSPYSSQYFYLEHIDH